MTMFDILKYQGRFFESADWFRLLVETTDLQPAIFSTETGALPCKRNGRHLESLTNFYSVEFSPVGYWGELLDHIHGRVDLKFLKNRIIEQIFRNCGFHVFSSPQYANWTCPIGTDFASYFAARPSTLRNTVKRKSKALVRDHDLRLEILTTPNVADYNAVYAESWKRAEPFPDFIPALMDTTSRLGILRLGLAYIDNEPAAAQLWIVESGRAMIYKLAYKEKFKATSVGSVLSHELFRHAIDVDGVSLIDYGVGDEPYKRDWMTHRGEVFQMTCLRRSARNFVPCVLRRTKRTATMAMESRLLPPHQLPPIAAHS